MDILVEEHPGANNELEDVLEGLHGLQQLLCQLLRILHIVLQNLGQLPRNKRIMHCVGACKSHKLRQILKCVQS